MQYMFATLRRQHQEYHYTGAWHWRKKIVADINVADIKIGWKGIVWKAKS